MAIHEFYRPQSLTKWSLNGGLAEGGSESSINVSLNNNSPAVSETKGYVVVKQGNKAEVISYTAAPDANTLTIGERGLPLAGTTGVALSETGVTANKEQFSPGATIEMADTHYYIGHLCDWGNGLRGSGSTELKIGLDTDVDIKLTAANSDANEPFLMYDASENAWVFSDDGVSTTKMVTGGGGLSAGDMIDITASAINVDLATDPGLESSSNKLRVKIKANGGIVRDSDGLSVDQSEDYTWSGTNNFSGTFQIGGTQVTSTADELNKLDGASANVTSTNLNTLTAGTSSDADALHTHGESGLNLGVGSATSNKGYANLIIPFSNTSIWTTTNYNEVLYGSHITGSATGAVAIYNTNINFIPDSLSAGKDVIVEFFLELNNVGTYEGSFGVTENVAAFGDYNYSAQDTLMFSYDTSGNFYANVANGTGTTTAITGVTLTDLNRFRIHYTHGVDVKFYVNSALKATVSTNLPTNFPNRHIGAGTSGASDEPILITNPIIAVEI